MRYSELPRPLREKIRGYYAEVWTRHEEVCKGAVTMTSMQRKQHSPWLPAALPACDDRDAAACGTIVPSAPMFV